MLEQAREQFSYVFLDAPAGIDLGFRLCASYADRVILVTCPEPAAVRDAARAGELLELMGKPEVRLVVNRVNKKMFDLMEEFFPDIAYLPIIREDNGVHDELMRRHINYVGAEVLFDREENEVGSPAYIDKLHNDGRLAWANAIIYNHRTQLSAGHSDDISAAGDPEGGWGWLADRGFDLIQTDWPLMMRLFLEETGRRFKK